MLHGSCLCSAVTYEVDCSPQPFVHCHCQTCRKTHGSAFSTVMGVAEGDFNWVSGKNNLNSFESSPGKHRYFCKICGSHIVAKRENADIYLLRLGCLDTPVDTKAILHIWRSDCATWYDPDDKIDVIQKGIR